MRLTKTRVAIAAALAALALVAAGLIPSRTALTIRAQRTGELRFWTGVEQGDEFAIGYVHSVNRRPVLDTLRVEGTGLRVMKSRFDAFGAGMPDTSTPDHPLRRMPDGRLEYTVDRPVPDVTLFVGRVAQHTLHVHGREIAFADLSRPGSAVRISVEKLSPFQRFATDDHHERP